MRHLTTLLLLLLFSTLSPTAMSAGEVTRPYYFHSLNIDNGLSNNSVNVILQDRRGMMWFGTKDGLNLFNGISCRTFRKENSFLGNNFIIALHEASDGRIWVGTDSGVYIYDPINEEFSPLPLSTEDKELATAAAACFCSGPKEQIYVAYNGHGLYRCDTKGNHLVRVPLRVNSHPLTANVSGILFDKSGRLWVTGYEDNLYSIDNPNGGECRPYTLPDGSQPFRGVEINGSVIDSRGRSFIGTNRGLYVIDHQTRSIQLLMNQYVRSCCSDGAGQLWVGTENGIYILNPVTMESCHILATHITDSYSLSDNAIYCIYRDHEDGIWIGSYFGGINYWSAKNSVFRKTYPNEQSPLMGKRIREICPGLDGMLWVGTEDRGLFNYDPATGNIRPYSHPDLYSNIHGLCHIGDELWVGTFSGGLSRLHLPSGRLRHYPGGTGRGKFPASSVFCICHTSRGEILLGTIGGVYRYRPDDDSFEHLPELFGTFVYYILEDHLGNIWYATYDRGLYRQDTRHHNKLRHYMPIEGNDQSIPYHKVISLFEDSHYRLWIATQGGGCCSLDLRTGEYKHFNTGTGFPSDVVMRIVEDQTGDLWMTTNNGLVCIDHETGNLRHFGKGNGLLTDQFNYQSGYVDENGTVHLGSIGGLVSFKPQNIRRSQDPSRLVISDFYIFNDRATIGGKDSPLQQSIMMSDEVTLDVEQNTFSLRAAVLSYFAPRMNRVLYRLEGYDQDWQTLTGTDLIRYANLSHGTYHLHIKGYSTDGCETEERIIRLYIRPPFYLTPWAYIIYLLIGCGVCYSLYIYIRTRTMRKHERDMERLRQESERQLYDAKIDFFTNVAHEIRTPLTLIKSPLDHVLTSPDVTDNMHDDLEIMRLNTDRLLDLVNELLDFRKTEAKGFSLRYGKCDIARIMRHIHTRFMPYARQQGLTFTLACPDSLQASVDSEGFTKIVSNLFTNAIKYSASYVEAELTDTGDHIVLKVCNDGNIVPLQMREEIFKSFTRYNDSNTAQKPGSGVGLTLARSLAELHEGTLSMDDDLTCNRFVLTLPIRHNDTESIAESAVSADQSATPTGYDQKGQNDGAVYTLLVVEDNQEMQTFIRRQLISQYRVLTASDGQQALDVLSRESVHLIISDVMMPVMDGMALCHHVKDTLDYSHIPVILLTAKVGVQATIEGLQQGADAYIEKPFSIEHLRASIENLLKSREMLRCTFRNSPLAQTNTMAISKADEDFLARLHAFVMENLKDSELSIDQMASELAMSRSSFNRKIKALLDMSPSDYLRLERLKYAAELLQQNHYKINEICYMAGFNTPSYFSRCFQKQFGVLPNEFARHE